MRLYSLTGAIAVDHDGTKYEPGDDGGFAFPDDLADRLGKVAVGGVKQWETAAERSTRLHMADVEHKRSPEALYDAVARLVDMFGSIAGMRHDSEGDAPEPAAKTKRGSRARPPEDPAEPPA